MVGKVERKPPQYQQPFLSFLPRHVSQERPLKYNIYELEDGDYNEEVACLSKEGEDQFFL